MGRDLNPPAVPIVLWPVSGQLTGRFLCIVGKGFVALDGVLGVVGDVDDKPGAIAVLHARVDHEAAVHLQFHDTGPAVPDLLAVVLDASLAIGDAQQ